MCWQRPEDQLFFVLHYLKSNSIRQHHAAGYGMHQSQCHQWLHLTLKELGQTPERNSKKLTRVLAAIGEVFIDGTERPIERPQDSEVRKNHYSGKKKGTGSRTM